MVAPLRRAKLLDTAIAAVLLVLYTIVPISILMSSPEGRFFSNGMEKAFIALLGTSWPFLVLGAIALFYFWRTDNSVDKRLFSTATSRQLSTIMIATASVLCGAALIFVAQIVSLVDRTNGRVRWTVSIDVLAIVLVAFIVYTVGLFLWQVRSARKSLQEGTTDPHISAQPSVYTSNLDTGNPDAVVQPTHL